VVALALVIQVLELVVLAILLQLLRRKVVLEVRE
jgi:hypothetical protein